MATTNNWNFTQYSPTGSAFAGSNRINIGKRGGLGIHQGLCEEHNIHSFQFVDVFVDKDNWILGLKFRHDQGPDTMAAISRTPGKGKTTLTTKHVSTNAIWKLFGIDLDSVAGRHELTEKTDDGMLVFDLKARDGGV